MRRALALSGLAAAALALAAAGAVYVVGPTREVVLTRLGRPVALVVPSQAAALGGLHLKWPLIDRAVAFDRRGRTVALGEVDGSDADGRPLQASAYVRYSIDDPLRFYRRFGDPQSADLRMQAGLEAAVRSALATVRLSSGDLALAQGAARQVAAGALVRAFPRQDGVALDDLQLTGLTLPDADQPDAARRMEVAAGTAMVKVRADGDAARREAIAAADREAADIRGEAERQALEIRGEGDAQRTAILGAAYGRDPDFARFFRRLEAYDQALNPDNSVLVLSTDNAFFKTLAQGPAPH